MKKDKYTYTNVKFAKFLGATYNEDKNDKDFMNGITFPHGSYFVNVDSMEFHSNIGWIMAVVDKIESITDYRINLLIWKNRCTIDVVTLLEEKPLFHFSNCGETKHDAILNTCLAFISWYNENALKIWEEIDGGYRSQVSFEHTNFEETQSYLGLLKKNIPSLVFRIDRSSISSNVSAYFRSDLPIEELLTMARTLKKNAVIDETMRISKMS